VVPEAAVLLPSCCFPTTKDEAMADDHRTDKARGKLKEAVGKATDDERLEQQGKEDQARGSVKEAAKNVKDAVTGSDD
jgi:uncharacterized protein YjbJ (UPF0337 family)